ncbi:MAG: peptide chain release factor 2 [Candidatus Falkowbacteria bacterium]
MDNIIRQLTELLKRVQEAALILDLTGKQARVDELEKLLAEPELWQNPVQAGQLGKEHEELKSEIALWRVFEQDISSTLAMAREAGNDSGLQADLAKHADELEQKFAKLEFALLFAGEYDSSNCFLSIHAGTGGVEAQDWAQMLERMYLRYIEKQGWQAEVLERTMGNEAGIKSVLIKATGRYAYGNLKSEAGVHRLVRISPFDAEALRQTSFALVEVLPELPASTDIDIKPEEIEVEFYRSSGPGGQNVNKVSSAVRLKHLATGIVVACQTERSQSQNREQCMALLKAKLKMLQLAQQSEKNATIRGEVQRAEWGKQIRSYVLQPYQLVKDHRTNYETDDTSGVLDGELDGFIAAYLKSQAS